MNILATDIIEFEVSFRPNSKGAATSATLIGEDSFACELLINSDDNRFWKANIEEGYYLCNGAVPVSYPPITAGDGLSGTVENEELFASDFCAANAYDNRGSHVENTDGVSWATPYTDDD